MRPTAAVLAFSIVLVTTAAHAASICSYAQVPPKAFQQKPNVDWVLSEVAAPCGGRAVACTEQYAPGKWVIEIPSGLNASERFCLLRHETAHLPPNNWGPGHGRACDRCAVFQPGKKVISNYARRLRR